MDTWTETHKSMMLLLSILGNAFVGWFGRLCCLFNLELVFQSVGLQDSHKTRCVLFAVWACMRVSVRNPIFSSLDGLMQRVTEAASSTGDATFAITIVIFEHGDGSARPGCGQMEDLNRSLFGRQSHIQLQRHDREKAFNSHLEGTHSRSTVDSRLSVNSGKWDVGNIGISSNQIRNYNFVAGSPQPISFVLALLTRERAGRKSGSTPRGEMQRRNRCSHVKTSHGVDGSQKHSRHIPNAFLSGVFLS